MKIERGTTRTVFLVGGYAIKIARIWHKLPQHRWKMFLRGMLANMDEYFCYKFSPIDKKKKLCPVKFISPLGLILVMKRAEKCSEEEFNKEAKNFFHSFAGLPLDAKIENFGIINGELVLIDYADSRYNCSDCSQHYKNR